MADADNAHARDNGAELTAAAWPLTTRENERSRLTVDGERTDNAERCTVVVIHECTGSWSVYPHGFGKFGAAPRGAVVSGWR